MYQWFFKGLQGLHRNKKGITGLETAIILIAFVTVASVLAYSVLSAGIFSSEKGKATVYSGLQQASATMQLKGDVLALDPGATGSITSVQFTVASVLQDAPVDMTAPDTVSWASGTPTFTANDPVQNTVIINYSDATQTVNDIGWAATPVGQYASSTSNLLQNNEEMVVTVDLSSITTPPTSYGTFTLQIVPPTGAAITITRTLPASIGAVTDLH